MPTYPQQLITSLCDHLADRLVSFFSIERLKYFGEYHDLNELVADTLWNYIKNETQKSDIHRSRHAARKGNAGSVITKVPAKNILLVTKKTLILRYGTTTIISWGTFS